MDRIVKLSPTRDQMARTSVKLNKMKSFHRASERASQPAGFRLREFVSLDRLRARVKFGGGSREWQQIYQHTRARTFHLRLWLLSPSLPLGAMAKVSRRCKTRARNTTQRLPSVCTRVRVRVLANRFAFISRWARDERARSRRSEPNKDKLVLRPDHFGARRKSELLARRDL